VCVEDDDCTCCNAIDNIISDILYQDRSTMKQRKGQEKKGGKEGGS
jgi:hypothetical protein